MFSSVQVARQVAEYTAEVEAGRAAREENFRKALWAELRDELAGIMALVGEAETNARAGLAEAGSLRDHCRRQVEAAHGDMEALRGQVRRSPPRFLSSAPSRPPSRRHRENISTNLK